MVDLSFGMVEPQLQYRKVVLSYLGQEGSEFCYKGFAHPVCALGGTFRGTVAGAQ